MRDCRSCLSKDCERVNKEDLRVDGTDHTSLAMLALGAVEPYRLCILNTDGVGQDLRRCGDRRVGGHEAREEGIGLVGHDVLDGDTRVVECGLHDGVVLKIMLLILHRRKCALMHTLGWNWNWTRSPACA